MTDFIMIDLTIYKFVSFSNVLEDPFYILKAGRIAFFTDFGFNLIIKTFTIGQCIDCILRIRITLLQTVLVESKDTLRYCDIRIFNCLFCSFNFSLRIDNSLLRKIQCLFSSFEIVFCLLLRIAAKYLQFLKQIDKIFNYAQKQLHKAMTNKALLQLLSLEKSLVYFSTSLKNTETVLEKLLRGRIIKLYDEDQELLEDVLVEVKQAIEMSNIYSNILSNTMDAYSNVISNNLNQAMKVLTVITIVLELPTIVFSFYGMNVSDLPFPQTLPALGIAAVLAVTAALILTKSKFYK